MKHFLIKTGYGFLFLLTWLSGMYYIFFYTSDVRDHGAEKPAGQYIVPHSNHGDVVYITQEQDFFLQLYGYLLGIAFACLMILGHVLQGYGIQIYRGIKTGTSRSSEQKE